MAGQLTATKPSRSDEVLDADLQQKITTQVRPQFDFLAPKRPAKPNRSEPNTTSPSAAALPPGVDQSHQTIPELDKLRSLQYQFPVKILVEGELEGPDESLETEYYRELDSIDKQHHTTGNEFMRMKAKRMENRVIRPPLESSRATNHWIPDEFSF